MSKVKAVIAVIVAVVIGYIGLLIVMPTVNTLFQNAADTLSTRPGIEKYLGAVELMTYLPWLFWFVPAVIGFIALVIVLRYQGE